jgi:hypothetical protein
MVSGRGTLSPSVLLWTTLYLILHQNSIWSPRSSRGTAGVTGGAEFLVDFVDLRSIANVHQSSSRPLPRHRRPRAALL